MPFVRLVRGRLLSAPTLNCPGGCFTRILLSFSESRRSGLSVNCSAMRCCDELSATSCDESVAVLGIKSY
jgi:hypothetical protein